jgi:hypothetical protein
MVAASLIATVAVEDMETLSGEDDEDVNEIEYGAAGEAARYQNGDCFL